MKKLIRPIGPFAPPDPKTGKLLEGDRHVEWSTYWKRRELDGSIEVVVPVAKELKKKDLPVKKVE